MKVLIAVVVLTALALVGSRRMRVSGAGPPAGRTLLGGSEFILIGLLLGSDVVNLIDRPTLEGLRPFVYVALGWLAFLFGLQFDQRTVARIPSGFLAISVGVAAATMLAVAPPAWLLLARITDAPGATIALAAATLAASAACTGQTAIALVGRNHRSASRHLTTLLRFVSSLDPAVGVITFGIALSLLAVHPIGTAGFPWTLQWLVVAVCLGFLTAWIFVSLTLTRTSQAELALYLLGVIALSSGAALGFNLSVLFINFGCGVVVANLAHVRSIRGRLMDLLARGERFLYLLLLVVAGAFWHLPTAAVAAAAAVYLGARLLGKVGGGFVATRSLARQHPVPPLIGLGLASQGGMGLAIVIEYRFAVDDPLVPLVFGIAMSALLVNELAAPWLVRRVVAAADGGSP